VGNFARVFKELWESRRLFHNSSISTALFLCFPLPNLSFPEPNGKILRGGSMRVCTNFKRGHYLKVLAGNLLESLNRFFQIPPLEPETYQPSLFEN